MAYRFVLCATDLSPAATRALRLADDLARSHGARFGVLLITPTPLGSHTIEPQRYGESYAQVPAAQTQAMEALKGHVAETLAATGPGPELWVEHGTPYAVIVEQVEALGADLLVLGAQGRSGRKAGLGSITERALRHAPCSVLIAREQGADQRIVAATDFSDSARRALSAAADEARRRGARLTIVHSIGPLVAPPMPFEAASWPAPGAISVEQRDQARREAQARLEDLAGLEVDCELVVTEGDPAADVVKAAEERSAGLVVVGGVGRTGLARVLLGSVAEKVARRAPCSVLVAR